MERNIEGHVRIPILDKYKDMGSVYVLGKLESGTLYKGATLIIQPGNRSVDVLGIEVDNEETDIARPGENVAVKLKGIEEDALASGFVLGSKESPPSTATRFGAKLSILKLLEHKPIITSGYSCILHIHSLTIECTIISLVSSVDRKTGKKNKIRPQFAREKDIVNVVIEVDQSIAIETYENYPQLGRLTLRDEGKTIAIGKVLKILEYSNSSL